MPYLHSNTTTMNQNKSIIAPTWVNGFTGTSLEQIATKYQHVINRTNAMNFNIECIQKLKEIYGDSYIKEIQQGLNFVIHNVWDDTTYVWQMIYNVNNILRPIQVKETFKNEYLELIKQLQTFGLYAHFKIDDTYYYTLNDIKKLKKQLIECQNSNP